MASSARDITFVVPGQLQTAAARRADEPGRVKASVRVGAVRGDGGSGATARVTARPGEDVVVLTIAGGPSLVLHPEDARDLMRAQAGADGSSPAVPGSPARRGSARTRGATGAGTSAGMSAGTSAGDVVVSAQLGWPTVGADATRAATRGIGQAILSSFEVVTDLFKDPAAKLAAAAVTRHVDGQVVPGVYKLRPDSLTALKDGGAKLDNVPASQDGGPLLVLVHGTFVDTASTFRKLWEQHADVVRKLFAGYGDRVYALDHPTMGVSPIGNALTLARAMPAGARLHLVTHSRGGLVAEVLARACSGQALRDADLKLFAGDGYAQHRADLTALVKLAQSKGLKVERMVRVACPSRGTLLASRRFDAYLSVLKWSLELAGVPVAPQLVDFLHEVARRRAQPDELPGIEAMMPESPMITWLNNASEPIPGELRVVAGDMQGDSIGSWVKTLLSDAFYWTDNDLVVQTRSMYGGAPRAADAAGPGATFILDRGAQVSHFSYFANERTVNAIAGALVSDQPADFATIGPLSWAGQDASGTRAAKAVARSRGATDAQAADRPAVFVLPGILGSNLKLDGKRIWLGFRFVNGLKQLAWDPKTAARVEPDGPIGMVYDDLIDRLADTHEVIPFAFDWRRPIEDEARRLAAAVDLALAARSASQQPVRIIAHSMGGLVARTMRLEKPDTWRRMMARDGARFLMLGTPNGGSWAPMQVMSGDDTFGNALVAFGSLFDNDGARKMMAGMPGFLQLQASLLDPKLGLDKASSWQKLADDDIEKLKSVSIWHLEGPQRTIYEWGAPPQAVLDQAVDLRRRLDAQIETLDVDAQKMLLVVGHASFTPAGITLGDNGLEYLNTPDDGDGRVTLQSALLPGVKTWKLDAEHGKLPEVSAAFAAYVELLTTGDTSQLVRFEAAPGGARGAGAAAATTAAPVRSRPSRGLSTFVPPSDQGDVFGLGHEVAVGAARRTAGAALRIAVLNGDLKFVRQPLMVGHYRSLVLTGTERVVDRLVDGAMSRSLDAGLYPDATGSHQIFDNERKDPDNVFDMARPSAVIVAGLGEEGKLNTTGLVYTVRQAILAFAQRVHEESDGTQTQFELAATLVGSGGIGVTVGSAAQLIAQGALEANAKLQGSRWPQLEQLTLVELYLDRASDAWRALQLQEIASPNRLKLIGKVASGAGALRRLLDSGYRGASYDLISAVTVNPDASRRCIAFTLDTKRARAEVRAQQAQASLLTELVLKASNDGNRDPLIGRTLFNLLIPMEIEPFLAGTSEMLLELDPGTAGIPWELLDTNPDAQSGDQRPWAIRSKLLRRLRLEEFRAHVQDASADDNVLVIGEPMCDKTIYPPLPGARDEAIAVAACLAAPDVGVGPARVRSLVNDDDAQTVINALFERPYRVVHVAGHGAPGADGGVVLSGKNTYLGANEVRAMRVVPELVFLNCCHLAGRDAASVLQRYDRAAFAANIAEELIKAGVRCVIAAGWAVEDDPAKAFATKFYSTLLGGARFIDAVAAARSAAWTPNGNTWAAYQCYGDPEWRWRRHVGDAQQASASANDEFAGVASPVSLALTLENLSIASEYGSGRSVASLDAQADRVRHLEAQFAPLWGSMGAVAEAFGVAFAATNEVDRAIAWFRSALDAQDASASFRAAEQLGNLLVRQAAKLDDAAKARVGIVEGIANLEKLAAVQMTIERGAMLGSAYKRLSMVEWKAKRMAEARSALNKAIDAYGHAEAMARKLGAANLFYPAKNGISCELRAAFVDGRVPKIEPQRLKEVSDSLQVAASAHPDFWSVVGLTELQVLSALAQGSLASVIDEVIERLREHKQRVPAVGKWDSVYNDAQFTLVPYLANARLSPAEKRAAQSLLGALREIVEAGADGDADAQDEGPRP